MKALVYTAPERLEMREVPEPSPASGEAAVQVESVGICGSDMHAYLGHDERRPAPLILGHEAAGMIVTENGSAERVTVNPIATCGKCSSCLSGHDNLCPNRQIISMPPREGGFAQRIAIPEKNLVKLPDGFGFDQAALAEPLACGWHAARLARERLADANPEEGFQALVIGGGAIGLGAALSLEAQAEAEAIMIEPNPIRKRFLQERCARTVFTPDELDPKRAFDIVFDAVGYPATRAQASSAVRPGGVIVHIGLGSAEGGFDIRRATLQEIAFIGSYAYTAQDFRNTAKAMFEGRLGPLDWIEARPLPHGAEAFEDIRSGRTAAPKIILKPQSEVASASHQ